LAFLFSTTKRSDVILKKINQSEKVEEMIIEQNDWFSSLFSFIAIWVKFTTIFFVSSSFDCFKGSVEWS